MSIGWRECLTVSTTKKASEVAIHIQDLIDGVRTDYGIEGVYYGDIAQIVDSVCVCVEPANKIIERINTGLQSNVEMRIAIIVYVSSDDGAENVQSRADSLCEDLESYINMKAAPQTNFNLEGNKLGGLIIDGMITEVNYDYRLPGGQITRANRMIFTCLSRVGVV